MPAQERERQAVEQLTATAASLVQLKARAAQAEVDSVSHKQQIQSLRQEYRQMTVKLDAKVTGPLPSLVHNIYQYMISLFHLPHDVPGAEVIHTNL